MVDLRHQRLQFHRHLVIELRALALLQLGDLLSGLFQWAQGAAHGDPLQQQNQQQPRQPEAQADLLHAPKTLAHGRVVLRHTDRNRLPEPAIVRTQHQQLLTFRPQLQVAVQAGMVEWRQFLIPQRAGTPMLVGEIDTEVVPGKRPLIGRRQVPLIQLQPRRPAHQRHQQVFTVVAQTVFEVTLQPLFEQPQAGLRQHQADDHHHADQPQTQAALNRPHWACPPNR